MRSGSPPDSIEPARCGLYGGFVISSQQLGRVASARVGRLATLRADGTPRLVPITFALVDGLICFAVDEVKPKTTTKLARLADIARDARVALVVDHYAEDWSQLWWVRVDGRAAVHGDGELRERALAALRAKYEQYRAAPLGAVVVITPTRWSGWAADAG
jgi:PPOX class probable F420-dependent enzyme